jgi:RNA processing factor Prp31
MTDNAQLTTQAYSRAIQDLDESINCFFSYCCEYQSLYFDPEEYKKNFLIYQNDVEANIEKSKTFFEELPFNAMRLNATRISFNGDFGKVEDFRKLKKPTLPKENKEIRC